MRGYHLFNLFSGLIAIGVVAAAATSGAASVATQGPAATGIRGIFQPGDWQMRLIGGQGEMPAKMCVSDVDRLFRIEHQQARCTQVIIDQGPTSMTVHYSCPGTGWGRTTIRMETPRLGRIETQGISKAVPFAYDAEIRRTGDCPVRGSTVNKPSR
jgi:hypothetical protein